MAEPSERRPSRLSLLRRERGCQYVWTDAKPIDEVGQLLCAILEGHAGGIPDLIDELTVRGDPRRFEVLRILGNMLAGANVYPARRVPLSPLPRRVEGWSNLAFQLESLFWVEIYGWSAAVAELNVAADTCELDPEPADDDIPF